VPPAGGNEQHLAWVQAEAEALRVIEQGEPCQVRIVQVVELRRMLLPPPRG
jgi:hypothetical protein